jgi:UDP-N-acetylmuramoyl-L-alanyl-D-glutamate--2,6-diaminopimelate ligase
MALGQLASATGGQLSGDPHVRVSGLAYDSRQVAPGSLFAALRGSTADGHRFLDDAVRRGAAAVLTEEAVSLPVPSIVVEDGRAALARAAAAFFDHPSRQLPVIGITGTDGKTTTSFLVKAILDAEGYQTGLIGTTGVRIADEEVGAEARQTTPESIDVQRHLRAMVDERIDYAILEATSHGLAMHRLNEIEFRIGAVTNITHEHLEYHGTIEAYRRAKALLFERVARAGGAAILNVDDEGAMAMTPFTRGSSRVLTYSAQGKRANLGASHIVTGLAGTRFDLQADHDSPRVVTMPLLGLFNVENALCALGVTLAAGVGIDAGVEALRMAPAVPGRMVLVDEGQPFSVVVDYAHTPESLAKVLTLLRSLTVGGRIIVVFGSAGERDVEKRALQGGVAARLADVSYLTNEDPRNEDEEQILEQIAVGAKAMGAREGEQYFRITDRREAIKAAFAQARPGDCVLLAGKGHEHSILTADQRMPWDEQAIARELLRTM